MEKESYSGINNKYVLILVEDQNQYLSVKEFLIEDSETIVSNIEAIVENPKKTLWDLFSIVNSHLGNKKKYHFCFPYEYNSSYISDAIRPPKVPYNYANTTYHEYSRKKNYAKKVIRFIKCKYLSEAFEEVKKDGRIKMFSSDSIGWTTFEYPISEDIKVMIKTNFVYGSAAYFYLTIKYKGIVLIPYSDLVHYYYANMKNLISYTRTYACKRDSWHFALNFIAYFVNKSKEEPKNFIRKYVLSEVKDMMKGLRATMSNPKEIMKFIKDANTDYIDMKVIRPFSTEDKHIYEMMPQESISVFKAEKISGALLFLENLEQIQCLCPEVVDVMQEVKDMNVSIKPEVESTIKNIKLYLEPLERERDNYYNHLISLENKIDFHKKQIEKIQKRKPESPGIVENYINNHSEYSSLLEERESLLKKMQELAPIVSRRKRLLTRMTACLGRINKQEQNTI